MSETEAHGGHNSHGEHSEGEGHEMPEAMLVYFTFAGLLLGAILREVNKKTKFPYTPLLLIFGLIIGTYVEAFGELGSAIKLALNIEPEGILMIFIPTLIFESAFNADWYIFKKAGINILMLAGPGVLLGAFMLAFCLKVILGYGEDDLSWPGALTIGSVVCTTDPVAVVALLKEMGAPMTFNLLVEGESLLNDGIAMVFFMLFVGLAKGEEASPVSVVGNFVQLSLGGPLVGLITGVIASLWLKRITRDSVLSITITFIACYLLFYGAEEVFHVSGILAIVTLGLFMSANGKTNIDPESEHSLHAVWQWVQYGCETLIFLMTGLLIGYNIIHEQDSTITSSDWVKMIIFYFLMIAARTIMFTLFLPVLRNSGYGLNNKELIVSIWGGLRGALGLALALMVGVDEGLPKRMRDLTVFYMAGMATFTLLINGTTCSTLVKKLEMVAEPEIKKRLQRNYIAEMILKSQDKRDELKGNKFLSVCDWKKVDSLIGLDELFQKVNKEAGIQQQSMDDLSKTVDRRTAYNKFEDDDIFQETRFRFLRVMKGVYWEKFEQSQISGDAAKLLVEGINVALDQTSEPINLWSFIYEYFVSFKSIRFLFKIKDFFLIGRLAKRYIKSHLGFIYEVTTAFVQACDEIIGMENHIYLSKYHVRTIIEEFEKNKVDATTYIVSLEDTFHEIIKSIQVQRAANTILEHQKHFLNELLESGQIEDKEYMDIRHEIDRKLVKLGSLKTEWEAPTFDRFMIDFPFFSVLQHQELELILKRSVAVNFQKGNYLYEKDQKVNQLFIITKGVVREHFDKKMHTKGIGSLMNIANVVSEDSKACTSAICHSDVQAHAIPHEVIRTIMDSNPSFKEKVYKESLVTFLYASYHKYSDFIRLDENKIVEVIRRSTFSEYDENQKLTLPDGGFLFNGSITRCIGADDNYGNTAAHEPFSLIPPNNFELITQRRVKLVEFDPIVRDIIIDSGKSKKGSINDRGPSGRFDFKRVSFREAYDMK